MLLILVVALGIYGMYQTATQGEWTYFAAGTMATVINATVLLGMVFMATKEEETK